MAKVRIKGKDVPGVILIERNMHDEAIVVSGSLIVANAGPELQACVAGELEAAAHMVNELGGIIGHIKAAVCVTSMDMISVTEEKAMVKTSRLKEARITLTVIVFLIEPEEAEDIARKALTAIRRQCKV